jgi:hypothetical protein
MGRHRGTRNFEPVTTRFVITNFKISSTEEIKSIRFSEGLCKSERVGVGCSNKKRERMNEVNCVVQIGRKTVDRSKCKSSATQREREESSKTKLVIRQKVVALANGRFADTTISRNSGNMRRKQSQRRMSEWSGRRRKRGSSLGRRRGIGRRRRKQSSLGEGKINSSLGKRGRKGRRRRSGVR